jgi:hypothetical protein
LNRRAGRRDQPETGREAFMLQSLVKPMVMVLSAAAIAALATFASVGGSGGVSADPLPAPQAAAIKACAERPWPYNTCVDTAFGKRHIRLVTTDRLPPQ